MRKNGYTAYYTDDYILQIDNFIDWNYEQGFLVKQLCTDPIILPNYEKVNNGYLVGMTDRNKIKALNEFLVDYRGKLTTKLNL